MNDASNASILILLAVGSAATAFLVAIWSLLRFSRLDMQDPWNGADVIELPDRHCTCGSSWCPYTPNKEHKKWTRP